MLRSVNYVRNYGTAFISLGVLVVMIVSALHMLYTSSGYGHQPTITAADERHVEEASSVAATKPEKVATQPPVRMILPTVDIGLDIVNATIDADTNEWPLSDTTAQYANFTPGLGSERGTMLLYGHNSWPVLRKSNDLEVGDGLVLVDAAGKQWRFVLEEMENVTPEQVGFIYEDTPFRVVIFTCNGWNDQYRRLMYFTPAA